MELAAQQRRIDRQTSGFGCLIRTSPPRKYICYVSLPRRLRRSRPSQAFFLAGAALVLAFQSIQRLAFPEDLTDLNIGLWTILGSLLAAAGLVLLQTYVVRKTGSTAIAADRAHYLTDVAVNLAVLAALGVTQLTGWRRADPLFAIIISSYMLWNGFKIAAHALEQLLDRELPDKERNRINEAVRACNEVQGVHDLRTRHAGDRFLTDFISK